MAEQMMMTSLPPGRAAEHEAAIRNALRLAEARLKHLDDTRARALLSDDEIREHVLLQSELARLRRELEEAQAAPSEDQPPPPFFHCPDVQGGLCETPLPATDRLLRDIA